MDSYPISFGREHVYVVRADEGGEPTPYLTTFERQRAVDYAKTLAIELASAHGSDVSEDLFTDYVYFASYTDEDYAVFVESLEVTWDV